MKIISSFLLFSSTNYEAPATFLTVPPDNVIKLRANTQDFEDTFTIHGFENNEFTNSQNVNDDKNALQQLAEENQKKYNLQVNFKSNSHYENIENSNGNLANEHNDLKDVAMKMISISNKYKKWNFFK